MASSHLSSDEAMIMDSALQSPHRLPYYMAKPLPFELREHCVIYFEEHLYNQALTLLMHLSTPSAVSASSEASLQQIFVPPSKHISLAATLIVHPSLTSQNTSSDRLQASNSALRLLHTINSVVGPVNADFVSAFKFHASSRGGRASHDRRKLDRDDASDNDQIMDHINLSIANASSLWACGEDFWHVVGWALNCPVAYPRRWTRWKLWLEFMITVLQDDWKEREQTVTKKHREDSNFSDESAETILADSMIVKYLPGSSAGYGGQRRIIRSIFADGSLKAQREFRPVFKDETKDWKEDTGVKRKRETKVNVDEEMYGDYFDDEEGNGREDSGTKTATPGISRGRASSRIIKSEDGGTVEAVTAADYLSNSSATAFGGLEAIVCRQSLLCLLSSVSRWLPNHFTTIGALYDSYLEYLRPLPLPIFSLFFSPTVSSQTEISWRSSLTQVILRSMISTSAPLSEDPSHTGDDDFLTQEVLERYYLPYPACTSNITDNAKVSLLIEALLRLLAQDNKLKRTNTLREANEEGINARERKTTEKSDGKRKMGGSAREEEEQVARAWLRGSSERLRGLIDAVMMTGAS